jgi:hypothetical protein
MFGIRRSSVSFVASDLTSARRGTQIAEHLKLVLNVIDRRGR